MTAPAAKSMGNAESQADFARRLSVSRQRVNVMIKAGLPVVKGGLIDVEAGLTWVRKNIVRKGSETKPVRSSANGGIDLTEARRLKVLADTAMVQLQLAKENGDLINRRDTRLAIAEFVRGQKQIVSNFATRFGQQIANEIGHPDPRSLVIVLDVYMRRLLDDLHTQRMPQQISEEAQHGSKKTS